LFHSRKRGTGHIYAKPAHEPGIEPGWFAGTTPKARALAHTAVYCSGEAVACPQRIKLVSFFAPGTKLRNQKMS